MAWLSSFTIPCQTSKCPAAVFISYWPQRGASASSAGRGLSALPAPWTPRWSLNPARLRPPEEGGSSGRQLLPHHAAWLGPAARSWASRHENRCGCSRSSGRCCSGSRSASCSRCCSSCHRGSRDSRTFSDRVPDRWVNATARPRASANSARVRHAPPRPAPSGSPRPSAPARASPPGAASGSAA